MRRLNLSAGSMTDCTRFLQHFGTIVVDRTSTVVRDSKPSAQGTKDGLSGLTILESNLRQLKGCIPRTISLASQAAISRHGFQCR